MAATVADGDSFSPRRGEGRGIRLRSGGSRSGRVCAAVDFDTKDDQAAEGEGRGPGEAESEVAPQGGVGEGPADGELHWAEGGKPLQDGLVGQRVAERVLQEGVEQSAHDDHKEALQIAL